MASFFITNNLGGGGTNVSRFVSYLKLYNNSPCDLLLNYYYLDNNFKKPVSFDTMLLNEIKNYSDIRDFLSYASYKNAIDLKRISKEFIYKNNSWNPRILLDSGSGNILRDKSDLLKKGTNKEVFENLISDYHNFAENLKFDIAIAFDYALKYTYKNNESENLIYKEISQILNKDLERNLSLLEVTLNLIKHKNYKHKIYAPIHGGSLETYVEYFKKIIILEKKIGAKFDGFAIGGIANTRIMDSRIWNLPEDISSTVKSNLIISSVIKNIKSLLNKNNDTRPIHVLGAGGIKNMFSLIYSGADSFDCHTPWRRSSDGNKISMESLIKNKKLLGSEWSKFLIPLVNSRLEVIPNSPALKYADIIDLDDNYGCDCEICKNYSMKQIKKMYCSSLEDNYFAKIILFTHATWQYVYLIDKLVKIVKDDTKIENFINMITDKKLKDDLFQIWKLIRK